MPTIKDVAQHASVSLSTVSKVINRTKRFTPAVEARVWQAVEALNFTPNPVAQSMITGRSSTIGVVILDISNPYFASLVKGASRAAAEHDYTVLLGDADESPLREKQLIEVLSKRADGLVLAGSRLSDQALRDIAAHKPLVVVGRMPGAPVSSVISNELEIAFQLTKHLINTGRKRIAYLSGPDFWVNHQRREGWRQALKKAKLEAIEVQLQAPTLDGGAAVAGELLLGVKPIDGVLAYNDLAALGFMGAAKTMGLRVPEDLAVAGIGDIPYANQSSPPLTTATVPSVALGRAAVELLFKQLEDKQQQFEPIVIPSRLRIRASTTGN